MLSWICILTDFFMYMTYFFHVPTMSYVPTIKRQFICDQSDDVWAALLSEISDETCSEKQFSHLNFFATAWNKILFISFQDRDLDRFFSLCSAIEEGRIPPRMSENNIESEIKKAILEIENANLEALVKFLAIVLDKLIQLLVRPPIFSGQIINVGQTSFEAMAQIVRALGSTVSILLFFLFWTWFSSQNLVA